MKNTRTIQGGGRVAVSHGRHGFLEGIVTENNPASALIYVEERPYGRYDASGAA